MARKMDNVVIGFSNVGGGLNTSDDMNQIRKNQVQQSLNAKLFKDGVFRRPGTEAGDAELTTNARGIHMYRRLNGSETILFMSAGKLYSTPTNLDSKTELYDLTGTGKAYFTNYLDKCWCCNGTENVKVEATTAYQIGITPPTSVAAAAAAGGTIPDGTYAVYACYARNVGGIPKLFSVGESVGNVVMGSGNNTIAITNFANSTDGQVGNKVIFLTEPAGATYFYYETNDNTTTSFNITSQANKDITVIYGNVAEDNTRPPAFEHIYAFDGSIFGSSGNVLYKSRKNTANVYELEIFDRNKVFPFNIQGIFGLGEHLYLNTVGGIVVLPYGDINAQWDKLTSDYFYDINTVREIPNKGMIGLTYESVRIFDGEKFLSHDISKDVKPEIRKIYTTTSGFTPFGFIVRTDERLEYHLSYNDVSLSSTSNNVRLVLNIDEIQLLPNADVIAPWEMWSCGFNYGTVNLGQTQYLLQDHTTPILYKLNTNNTYENGTYKNDGSIGTEYEKIKMTVTFRAYLINTYTMIRWNLVRLVANATETINAYLYIRESRTGIVDARTMSPAGSGGVWADDDDDDDDTGELVWDVGSWASEDITFTHAKTKDNMKGYIMYMKIEQVANDPDLQILILEAQGEPRHDRSTEMPQ